MEKTMKQEERGPWMQTFTGKAFHFNEPDAAEVVVEDVAHALSNLCRFGGHCRRFYSVAEHSVVMSHLLAPKLDSAGAVILARAGLFHDAEEAYTGDMVQPLKYALPDFLRMSRAVGQFVRGALGVAPATKALVREADVRLLMTERKLLLAPPPKPWGDEVEKVEPLAIGLECLPPPLAKQVFLQRYEQIETAAKEFSKAL